jgi:hypothetical protein
MKKSLKTYLWAWIISLSCLLLLLAAGRVFAPHHSLAKDGYSIEKIIEVDLPNVKSVISENNLDRDSSRWDCFTHEIVFEESLSKDYINQLEQLCKSDSLRWTKGEEPLSYLYEDGDWENYYVTCGINPESAFVCYYVDEDEGLFVVAGALLIINFAFFVLVIWGLALLVITLVRKKRNNRP